MIKSKFYTVKNVHSSEVEICTYEDEAEFSAGDMVVMATKFGKDIGKILGDLCHKKIKAVVDSESEIQTYEIYRKASEQDLGIAEENKAKEKGALSLCKKLVRDHDLDMNLVSTHFMIEDQKLLIFFTANERVDFRKLVRDIAYQLKAKIELRQIGVRDETRILGGMGVCGRVYCCHSVSDRLEPVSIRMAATQNLSLNSMKISGPCGRLFCCLAYEVDTYHKEKEAYPAKNSKIIFENKTFKVLDVNVLSRLIKMFGPEGQRWESPLEDFSYNKEKDEWHLLKLNTD
jgi:cell fate regulator YaaT (PSP1 superfamily)